MKTNMHFLSCLAHFFLELEMFETNFVEKIKTHILYSVTFFLKLCRLWDNVEKRCREGQDTDDNMAHSHFMIHKAANTLSEYVILIAFPLQQTLYECFSLLLYTGCPTRYRTRLFFNNFTTNEDIATKFEADLPHCLRNVTTS